MTDPIFIKRVFENVVKLAFGELNNIFQDEFNKNLQQSTNVGFCLSHNWIQRIKLKNKGQNILILFWNFCVG